MHTPASVPQLAPPPGLPSSTAPSQSLSTPSQVSTPPPVGVHWYSQPGTAGSTSTKPASHAATSHAPAWCSRRWRGAGCTRCRSGRSCSRRGEGEVLVDRCRSRCRGRRRPRRRRWSGCRSTRSPRSPDPCRSSPAGTPRARRSRHGARAERVRVRALPTAHAAVVGVGLQVEAVVDRRCRSRRRRCCRPRPAARSSRRRSGVDRRRRRRRRCRRHRRRRGRVDVGVAVAAAAEVYGLTSQPTSASAVASAPPPRKTTRGSRRTSGRAARASAPASAPGAPAPDRRAEAGRHRRRSSSHRRPRSRDRWRRVGLGAHRAAARVDRCTPGPSGSRCDMHGSAMHSPVVSTHTSPGRHCTPLHICR
jgi:hypothetical protein